MTSENLPSSPVILRKRTASRKHHVPSQSIDNTVIDNLRPSKTAAGRNRSLSRSSKFLPKAESISVKRCQSQQKEVHISTITKLERQVTTITMQTRLPTFPMTANDEEQKRTSDFRRRQIYALNHLMRNYEQEKFREFCKLHNIGSDHDQENKDAGEDQKNESST
ncbi:unnamed protein product [Adineta ricciae]|uniref:Uncharacterized protein n=1 Tax=Adineta ricciae TaxID=249248 RepID=A0A814PBQ1_ADIRI|nr:unnamed protein product [Adineta ricciae]CAF1103147.1 unnamed protein product [Adineta ricciae]